MNNTRIYIVDGADRLYIIIQTLIKDFSCWFEVTPLPYDEWELEVKSGEQTLHRYIAEQVGCDPPSGD